MTAPQVSIVIPMRNGARTIDTTLDSVLLQANLQTETVVVDDRSTDDGPARARAHPVGARVVPCEGVGRSAARNTGFRAARGRTLIFLDADDVLRERALEARIAALDGAGPDAVLVSSYAERLGGREREREAFPDLARTGDARLALLRRNQLAIHCATLRREDLLTWVGAAPFPEDLHALEDWDLWLRLAFRGARFVPHTVVDCDYLLRAGMTNTVPDSASDAVTVLDRAEALVRSAGADGDWRRRASRELRAARLEVHLWRAALWARTRRPLRATADLARALVSGRDAVTEVPALVAARVRDRRWRRAALRSSS
jgi:glycosyltransferase involved in cell wall biosynthesis